MVTIEEINDETMIKIEENNDENMFKIEEIDDEPNENQLDVYKTTNQNAQFLMNNSLGGAIKTDIHNMIFNEITPSISFKPSDYKFGIDSTNNCQTCQADTHSLLMDNEDLFNRYHNCDSVFIKCMTNVLVNVLRIGL